MYNSESRILQLPPNKKNMLIEFNREVVKVEFFLQY